MPEAMRETLFDSFKSSKADGNGLGLWIVKEIVHNHRGRIQFRRSTLQGKSGTIFRVFLAKKELAALRPLSGKVAGTAAELTTRRTEETRRRLSRYGLPPGYFSGQASRDAGRRFRD